MRFMMLMIPQGYRPSEAAPTGIPSAEMVAKMMAFNEDLQKAGALLALDGLHPLSAGVRLSYAGGEATVMDGPEAKDVLGGYWMIKAASLQEAVAWARRCPAQDGDIIEIRQVQEMSDFPEDVVQAAKENAPSLAERM